jgi:hypothetical protein
MGMRLGGWSRLGVVLAVLWAAVILSRVAYEYHTRTPYDDVFVNWVWEPTGNDYAIQFPPRDQPLTLGSPLPLIASAPVHASLRYGAIAIWLLLPPTGLWLVIVGLYRTMRWIRAGF